MSIAVIAFIITCSLPNDVIAYPKVRGLLIFTKETLNFYNNIGKVIKGTCFSTIVFVEGDYCTTESANKIIQLLYPCPVKIVSGQKLKSDSQYSKWSKHIFIFINNFKGIEKQLDSAMKHEFWNPRAYIYFFICQPVDNVAWINQTLKNIWKNNILHFTMSYYYYTNFEVVSYNPFFDKIEKLNNFSKEHIYQNKLRNLNGYRHQVCFFADPPRIVEKNGIFYGIDAMIMRGFANRLNATIEIVGPGHSKVVDEKYMKVFFQLYRRKCDFSFISSFATNETEKEITATYSRRMDGVVVLVPHASIVPQFYHMFMMFDRLIWTFICTSLFLVTLCTYLNLRTLSIPADLYNILLNYWGVMLSVSSATPQKLFSNRMLLLLWVISSFTLSSLFQSFLTSELITVKFKENMDTLAELKRNKTVIAINRSNSRSIEGQYPKNLILRWSEQKVIEMIAEGDTTSAYAIHSSIAELASLKTTADGYPIYHIIKELLIPGYTSYLFPASSPYLDAANEYVPQQTFILLSVCYLKF